MMNEDERNDRMINLAFLDHFPRHYYELSPTVIQTWSVNELWAI
jgi:hypothetical protein